MSKKKWPIFYSDLLYKLGNYFLAHSTKESRKKSFSTNGQAIKRGPGHFWTTFEN